ncbi:Chitinase-3-like protein 2 [Morella rubra]|uniref:Chitinase-3-like protein 2 n=1 Tax=Morella rubra TaxID=262757 RepID=A0A6A1VG35_9ROSI|nr:Chitinase-3-like protein 2 [Morella rubra]
MTADFVKAGYWSPISGFPVDKIESSNFTHLFFTFADLDPKTFQITFPSQTMSDFRTFNRIVKRRNPNVKTLLSIGGPTTNTAIFAAMASQESSRKSFICSAVGNAAINGFNGLDLSWLYPSAEDECRYFRVLLSEWRNEILYVANITRNKPLLLTAQIFCSPHRDPNSIPATCSSLDWINVLPYNFHSPDKLPNQIGSHAPWRSEEQQPSWETEINAWIEAGLDCQKVVLGLAPAKGATPSYATATSISYDDRERIAKRIQYAKEKNLLGYCAWHVSTDDNWMLNSKTGVGHASSKQAAPAQGTRQSQTTQSDVHQPHDSQGPAKGGENSNQAHDTLSPASIGHASSQQAASAKTTQLSQTDQAGIHQPQHSEGGENSCHEAHGTPSPTCTKQSQTSEPDVHPPQQSDGPTRSGENSNQADGTPSHTWRHQLLSGPSSLNQPGQVFINQNILNRRKRVERTLARRMAQPSPTCIEQESSQQTTPTQGSQQSQTTQPSVHQPQHSKRPIEGRENSSQTHGTPNPTCIDQESLEQAAPAQGTQQSQTIQPGFHQPQHSKVPTKGRKNSSQSHGTPSPTCFGHSSSQQAATARVTQPSETTQPGVYQPQHFEESIKDGENSSLAQGTPSPARMGHEGSRRAAAAQRTKQSQTTQPGVQMQHSQGLNEREKNSSQADETQSPAWLASFMSDLEVMFRVRLAPIEARLDRTKELMQNMRQDHTRTSTTLHSVMDKLESMSQAQARLKDRMKGIGEPLGQIEDWKQEISSIPSQLDTVNEVLEKLSVSIADITKGMPNCWGEDIYG